MSTTRERILQRIQTALHDGAPTGRLVAEQPTTEPVLRDYRQRDEAPRADIIDRFIERVTEYKAIVRRVEEDQLAAAIAEALAARGVERLVISADLPEAWLPASITLLRDAGDLSYETLGSSHGVLTGCALGIAQTGTLVLDHGALQGRRAISLVPDYHLCIVHAAQIVGLLPEAMPQLEAAVRAGRPITFISGPSATSDIELNRVEGVHGPRTLEVLVVI
ncbi:MAG: LUD domain-containing protein [Chloroflexi bacterium]|nr:LUD domain-containing protein [Chloroflexota bacterium]